MEVSIGRIVDPGLHEYFYLGFEIVECFSEVELLLQLKLPLLKLLARHFFSILIH